MAVHQHGLAAGRVVAGGGHFKEDDGRAVGQADDFQRQPCHFLRQHPIGSALHHTRDVSVLLPLRIKGWRLGRNGNVVAQLPHDVCVPPLGDGLQQGFGVEGWCGDSCIHGLAPCNLNTAVPAHKFGHRLTRLPPCKPKASWRCKPFFRASTSKSAKVPTRMLGVSYHW